VSVVENDFDLRIGRIAPFGAVVADLSGHGDLIAIHHIDSGRECRRNRRGVQIPCGGISGKLENDRERVEPVAIIAPAHIALERVVGARHVVVVFLIEDGPDRAFLRAACAADENARAIHAAARQRDKVTHGAERTD